MNNIQIFQNKQLGNIRIATNINNEPLFCLADVCEILGLRQGDVTRRLEKGVVSTQPLETAGGTQQANFVNEDGLYDVILDSRKKSARQFRKWVTAEVLPAIRRTGGYMVAKEDDSPEELMARALIVAQDALRRKEERLLEAEKKLDEQRPKVIFADAVEVSKDSILIGQLAKLLKQNGVDMGQNRLFEYLRNKGYLCKQGSNRNLPTQTAMEMNLFQILERTVNYPDGSSRLTKTTMVTGKGQSYFVNKFLDEE